MNASTRGRDERAVDALRRVEMRHASTPSTVRLVGRARRGERPVHPADRGRGRRGDARRPARRVDAGRRLAPSAPRPRRSSSAAAPDGDAPASGSCCPATRSSASSGSAPATGCTSTRPAARSQLGADRALHRARTARPTCSTSAASRRATTRRVPWRALLARLGGLDRDRRATARVRRSATRSMLSARARRRPAARCTCSRDPTPAARLRAFLRLHAACPRCCRSGPTGTGRAATSTSTSATSRPTSRATATHDAPARRDRARLAVGDAIQHVGVQPAPVPRRAGTDRAHARRTACARSCGSTPWVNLDSSEGQRPPGRRVGAAAPRAGAQLRRARTPHFVDGADGEPLVARWWMGTGSPVDFTSAAAERVVARAGQARRCGWASQGIKADDGEGCYFPHDVRFADGRTGARGRLGARAAVPALDAARARRGPPAARACCSAARAGPGSRRSASPGAATSRRTSGRCGRWSPRR